VAEQPRRWGWHRLTEHWAARIVAAAGVRPGELVLDIGAGEGALTEQLVAAGARVTAIELHPGRAARLRARFRDAPVRVVQADAAGLRLPQRPYRVVANPPYGLSVAILRQLLARGSALYAADLVLQRPYVTQVLGGRIPGSARGYELRRGLAVPRAAFRPPPRVDSAVLVIRLNRRR
jgi:23S rRNA (adenine-N6)-dimethyltransferase